jgi:hypothetical protein
MMPHALSRDLRSRAENYEHIQQRLASDMLVIDAKNREIKSLSEKLRHLEMGKAAPEFLKDLRQTKNQLKEMDLLVKRLRRTISTQTANVGGVGAASSSTSDANVNLSLDFYEKRIEKLEKLLKEKTNDLERLSYLFDWQKDSNVKIESNQNWVNY